MGVVVMSDGLPVTLDTKLWSLNPSTMSPWSPTSYVGASTLDPLEVWRTQRSVRTVVGFLARNIAQVALHGFSSQADGDRQRLDEDQPLSHLLRTPSATTTPYSAMHALVIDMCLWDRHASWLVGDPLELVRIPPQLWAFKRDRLGRPQAIVVTDEHGRRSERPLGEFLWLDGYPVDGCTPLDSLASLLAEEAESANYRVEMWRGGARMNGWIERPADAPDWTVAIPNQPGVTGRDNFRKGWQAYAASGARAGATPILEDGMKFHSVESAVTPETAQQLESRKFSVAEAAAAFYVPTVFVGLLDGANYSSVNGYRDILYNDTLGPWFQDLQQAYNARVVTHPAVLAKPGVFVEFNVGEKLRMNFDEQAKILQTATGGPTMTRNEARRRMNLPRIEGADELIVPLNVLTGGQASPTDSAPEGSLP